MNHSCYSVPNDTLPADFRLVTCICCIQHVQYTSAAKESSTEDPSVGSTFLLLQSQVECLNKKINSQKKGVAIYLISRDSSFVLR
jgi:hypothetical protein